MIYIHLYLLNQSLTTSADILSVPQYFFSKYESPMRANALLSKGYFSPPEVKNARAILS